MATIQTWIRHARLGLVCCAIAVVALIVSALGAKVAVGYEFPRVLLLFSLLADTSCACFFLWLLKRLKHKA